MNKLRTSFIMLAGLCLSTSIIGCQDLAQKQASEQPSLIGTWKLVSNAITKDGKTSYTFPVENEEMIKIINATHFSFVRHDRPANSAEKSVFVAGAGTYTRLDSSYIEQLDYCSAREWEGHRFPFTIQVTADSLIQYGIEKIDSLDVHQQIVERYVRLK